MGGHDEIPPRLVWILSANPDTSTIYVEVVDRSRLSPFRHNDRFLTACWKSVPLALPVLSSPVSSRHWQSQWHSTSSEIGFFNRLFGER